MRVRRATGLVLGNSRYRGAKTTFGAIYKADMGQIWWTMIKGGHARRCVTDPRWSRGPSTVGRYAKGRSKAQRSAQRPASASARLTPESVRRRLNVFHAWWSRASDDGALVDDDEPRATNLRRSLRPRQVGRPSNTSRCMLFWGNSALNRRHAAGNVNQRQGRTCRHVRRV